MSLDRVNLSLFILCSEKSTCRDSSLAFNFGPLNKISIFILRKLLSKTKCFLEEDISEKFAHVPFLIYPDQSNEIKNFNIDLILCFASENKLNEDIFKSVLYGVWIVHHGDISKYGVIWPFLGEIINNENTSTAAFYKYTDKGEYFLFKKMIYRIDYNSISKFIDMLHFQSTALAIDTFMEVFYNAEHGPRSELVVAKNLNNWLDKKRLFKLIMKIAKKKITNFFQTYFMQEKWGIGLVECNFERFVKREHIPKIKWILKPSKNFYYADPFMIEKKGLSYLFFEKFDRKEKKGYIFATIFSSGDFKINMELAVSRPYHLSYPFVFQHDDATYMTLEEAKSNEICLYRLIEFPDKWERVATIVKGISGVDPTICSYDNLWWLFFVLKEANQSIKLCIYYSDNLVGPWKAHKKNPVKADVRFSRPAGRPFYYNGSLIRPAQDCSMTYGGRIVFNRIKILSPFEFDEEVIGYFEPSQKDEFNHGIHCADIKRDYAIFDAKKYSFTMNKILRIFIR